MALIEIPPAIITPPIQKFCNTASFIFLAKLRINGRRSSSLFSKATVALSIATSLPAAPIAIPI